MASLPHLKNSNSGRGSPKHAIQGGAQAPHFATLQTWRKAQKNVHCLISTVFRGKVTLLRVLVDLRKFFNFLRVLLGPRGEGYLLYGLYSF